MSKSIALFFGVASLCFAEEHTLTLKQAVQIAVSLNTEVLLARLDQQKAEAGIRIAKDPFVPKVYTGSGLAYTSGYPISIEGSPPSIAEARTVMTIFNRPKTYDVAQARENARGAAFTTQARQDDAVYRTVTLYLNTAQVSRNVASIQQEAETLQRVAEAVRIRVGEGRELPLEGKRADLDLARAHMRQEQFEADKVSDENSLAFVLGYPEGDVVHPADEQLPALNVPETEGGAIADAMQNNNELKQMQSQMQAKMLVLRGQKGYRLPTADLVANYALLAKRNYQDYFPTRFQRNNGEVGVSFTIPLLVGTAAKAYLAQSEADIARVRVQMTNTRNRVALDTRKGYLELKKAASVHEFARQDLDVAREQVSVLLAQINEGRASRQQVDAARFLEQEKWIALYDADHAVELAKLEILRQTGMLIAQLK